MPGASATPSLPDAIRGRFEGLDDCVHLVSHSLGAMPVAVRAAMARHADTWVSRSVTAWESWFPRVHAVADLVGGLMNAPPGAVVLHQNVSALVAGVLSALQPRPGWNKVVTSSRDFPTLRYVLAAHRDIGFDIVSVDATDGATIAEAVDDTTMLVAVSHVFFGTSEVCDLAPIVAAARRHGTLVMADAYQSLGTVPVDVRAMDLDFCVGGSIKWLCGGPGVAYLYARPSVARTLHPRATGWLSHQRPFAFEPTMREAEGTWRFLGGTPNPLAVEVAACGYEIIRDVGVPAIRAHSLAQTGRLIAGAEAMGCRLVTPREEARRGGTVVLDFAGAEAACAALAAQRIWVDYRPGYGLRVSPHGYTRADEVDRFLQALGEARRDARA